MKHESFEPKGSFFMLNENVQLGHGDCLELMKSIPDNSIDSIVTDPPYGTTQCKWDSVIPFEPMWTELKRVIKPNGAIVLFGGEPFSSMLRCSNLNMFKYDWIWKKPQGTGFLNTKKQPLRDAEAISVFYEKQAYYNPQMGTGKPYKYSHNKESSSKIVYGEYGTNIRESSGKRYPKTIIEFNNKDSKEQGLHPTQKPVALLEYLIKTYTQEGETVLDFTMGSGSTGVAALNTNRKFIGIELDDNYFNIAKERISCVMQSALLQ
ncbi:site-specific DNA-methyltransferase [Acinetobacter baumannii]|nr:site-specific DNA-methyltransferase [Acinetobacter baumannii]